MSRDPSLTIQFFWNDDHKFWLLEYWWPVGERRRVARSARRKVRVDVPLESDTIGELIQALVDELERGRLW